MHAIMPESDWQPPLSFDEKLKAWLVPPKLYIQYRARKEAFRGEPELHLLPFLVDRRREALDIGANKGIYSFFLARLCPRVHAFEPHPKLFPILKAAAAANVTCHNIALSDETGTGELRLQRGRHGYYSNMGGSLSAVKVPDSVEFKTVKVETRRLDDMGLSNIGFVKIDVEGYEMAVLQGGREILRRERPVLLVELEEMHTKRTLPEMIAEVEALGFRCMALANGVLTTAEAFDVDRFHRRPRNGSGDTYTRNFIFLPKTEPCP